MKSFLLIATRIVNFNDTILPLGATCWVAAPAGSRKIGDRREVVRPLCGGGVFLANLTGEGRSSGEQGWVTE